MDIGTIARNPIFRLVMAILIAPLLIFGPMAIGPSVLFLSIGIAIKEGLWDSCDDDDASGS